MQANGSVGRLMQALRCLPGVGPKSAQRMAYYLLLRNRDGARVLAESLLAAVDRVGYCERCRSLSETALCAVCASPSRDQSQLCVVEMPTDVYAIDQAGCYRGVFFVLNGRLSPLDGIGPVELGLDRLEQRLAGGEIKEVVLATNTTVEGEATAHYLGEMAQRHHIRTTRIAYGVPMGGELEFVDGATLSLAFNGRREF
ncbi:MAG: recombination protein RecR [Methylococcaceae bacterium]|nr:MAG: recombination protein RecR [Methylococcaceae bacterium]